jgi:hypothetical protein
VVLSGRPVWPRAVRVIMPMISPPTAPTAKACTASASATQPACAAASSANPIGSQA